MKIKFDIIFFFNTLLFLICTAIEMSSKSICNNYAFELYILEWMSESLPKNENSVMFYSTSCHFKLVTFSTVFLLWNTNIYLMVLVHVIKITGVQKLWLYYYRCLLGITACSISAFGPAVIFNRYLPHQSQDFFWWWDNGQEHHLFYIITCQTNVYIRYISDSAFTHWLL